MTPRPRLVCLGNLTLDDVVLPDGRERPGCTGGDALYATLAARGWEPRAELVAPVGDDFPPHVLERMRAAGLGEAGLPRRPLPTLHNRVEYRADGGRHWTLFATGEDFDALSPRSADVPPAYRGADAFMILAMTLPAQEELVANLRRPGALIALDPQEDYIFGNEEALRRMIGAVDIFLPSAEEAQRLLGHADWSAAARTFAESGAGIVVVKLGAEGCLVYDRARGAEFRLPAFPGVEAIDTTGAGDAFCGAFMAQHLQQRGDLKLAAKAGAVAASFAVSGYGVDPLFETSAEAMRRRFGEWSV